MKCQQLISLKRKVKKLKDIKVVFADCESTSTQTFKFRCGSIAWKDKHRFIRVKTFFSEKDYFDFIFSHFKICYFFNLAYDSNFIRNYVFHYTNFQEFQIASGNRLLGLKFDNKETKKVVLFKDIYPFAQSSLEKACKEYNCKTTKYNVDFDNCSNEEIKLHCENDVKMLLELSFSMREILFELFQQDLFDKKLYSPPSLSMKIFRSNFIKESLDNPFFLKRMEKGKRFTTIIQKDQEEFCRKAYKGGFCNVESTEYFQNIASYDVCSLYPFSITAIRFPTGQTRWTYDLEFYLEYSKKIPSVCLITMELDKPLICGVRNGKLVRLSGIFTEYLTSIEVFFALKHGAKILEFKVGLIFDSYDKHNSLSRYERFMFKNKCKSIGGKKAFFKLLCNAIYGKVSQDYHQESQKVEYCRDSNEYESKSWDSDVIHAIPFKDYGGIIIRKVITKAPKPFMMIIWGCLITAFARCYLLEQTLNGKSIYEDTDSVKITQDNIGNLTDLWQDSNDFKQIQELSKNKDQNITEINKLMYNSLGAWDFEGNLIEFRALAPKTYAYSILEFNKETKQEEVKKVVKCKGIPFDQRKDLYQDIMDGNSELLTDDYIKILGCKESLISKENVERDLDYLFGGVRKTRKKLNPKPKPICINEQLVNISSNEL